MSSGGLGKIAVVAVAAAAVAGIVRTKTLRYQYFHNYIIFEGMRMFCGILLYHYEWSLNANIDRHVDLRIYFIVFVFVIN